MSDLQAADHRCAVLLHKGWTSLWQAAQLKRIGQRILANFLGRRVRAAWNAWADMVQARPCPDLSPGPLLPLLLLPCTHIRQSAECALLARR